MCRLFEVFLHVSNVLKVTIVLEMEAFIGLTTLLKVTTLKLSVLNYLEISIWSRYK